MIAAEAALARGRWDEAGSTAAVILAWPAERCPPHLRTSALVISALVRARRGEGGYQPLLDEATQLAKAMPVALAVLLVAAARAEAAWLEGAPAERIAEPGDLVYKPRDVWHTFWNATDRPARLLEIISPAGFDHFFVELAALISSGQASPQSIEALNSAYGLQVDPDRTASIAAEHRLVTALPE